MKLGIIIQKTIVNTQMIHGSILEIYEMIMADFLVKDRLGKVRFFVETFLLTDTITKIILEMFFLIFLYVDIRFAEKELIWRS